jgi:hypothetical protein
VIETLRPLTKTERRLLRYLMFENKRRLSNYPRRMAFAIVTTLAPPFLATGIFSGIGWLAASIVWIGIGLLLAVWIMIPDRRNFHRHMTACEDALQHDQVRDIRLHATAMVAFEELDDEGATYAFQLTDERILFVGGDNLYPSARFPNSDFSLVTTLNGNDRAAMSWIVKHGHRIEPVRTIPADFKKHNELPAHLTIINGRIDDVEHLIKAASAGKAAV